MKRIKKLLTILIAMIMVCTMGVPAAAIQKEKILVVYFSMPETTSPDNMTTEEENSTVVINGVVLGNTQYVAMLIQENTGADIFRIEPRTPYTTNHSDLVALASEEKNDNVRPELLANVENLEQYDVIFLGYPNWWGDLPMILYTFLESHDLSGKMIIPFNTHGGSGFSNTINTIATLQPGATINRNGFTVSRNIVADCENDLIDWVNSFSLEDYISSLDDADDLESPDTPGFSGNSTPVEEFISRLYRTGLGREPDRAGLDFWNTGLSDRTLTGAKTAENFLVSEELENQNLSDSAYLDALYRALMNRESDEEGKIYWQNYLNNGVSRTGILRHFLFSIEFQRICDSYGVIRGEPSVIEIRDANLQLTMFINRQYREILGRSGDDEGINFWADNILAGAFVEDVSKQFVFSEEFTSKEYSQEDFLRILYRAFMGRESDPSGFAYWQGEMNAGMSREDVFTSFVYSAEFVDIVASFQI